MSHTVIISQYTARSTVYSKARDTRPVIVGRQ